MIYVVLFSIMVVGCSVNNNEGIDINKLIDKTHNKMEFNKERTIAEFSPKLEETIKQLESICTEISNKGNDNSKCHIALTKSRKELEDYKDGEWDR
ncbi:MAG: hypothetical protein AB2784_21865 [Candidatus Thiodiazotropha endolucinida]